MVVALVVACGGSTKANSTIPTFGTAPSPAPTTTAPLAPAGITSVATKAAPSTTTTGITSVSTKAAPSTTTTVSSAALLGPFVGTWTNHGMSVSVNSSGSGTAGWRTYSWCSAGAPPPCDSMNGDVITNGGAATFTISAVNPPGVAHAIATSNQPTTFPTGPMDLSLATNDELLVSSPGTSTITLCGPSAPSACGGA